MKDPRHPFLISHGLIDYPFPLSDGTVTSLILPEKITAQDAIRVADFLASLVLDDDEEDES